MSLSKTELIDLFWRALWTFIAAATGGASVDSLFDIGIGNLDLILLSGGGAVVTMLKTFASNKLGTGTGTSKPEASVGLQPVASDSARPA
jgi:Tfp pilus assembly PilM family ATPase